MQAQINVQALHMVQQSACVVTCIVCPSLARLQFLSHVLPLHGAASFSYICLTVFIACVAVAWSRKFLSYICLVFRPGTIYVCCLWNARWLVECAVACGLLRLGRSAGLRTMLASSSMRQSIIIIVIVIISFIIRPHTGTNGPICPGRARRLGRLYTCVA